MNNALTVVISLILPAIVSTNTTHIRVHIFEQHNPQHDRIAGLVFDELKAKPTGVFVEFWTRALLQLEISPQNKELQRELLDTSEHLISVCYLNLQMN